MLFAMAGCGTKTTAPTEIRPNVYTLDTEVMQALLSGSEANAKKSAVDKASEHCVSMGKTLNTQSLSATRTSDGAVATIVYQCD